MPIKKPLTDWERRLNGYFISFARRVFHWSPAYRAAVKAAEMVVGKKTLYRCASCKSLVERSEKHVDHISPVIEVGTKWSGSWDYYRDRLFVSERHLQVLCKSCHKKKTEQENTERKRIRGQEKKS